MAAMTVEMAPMRQLTVVSGWGQIGRGAPGKDISLKHTPHLFRESCTALGHVAHPTLPAPEFLSGSLLPPQKARRAVPPPSPALVPMCASPSAGSVTVTRTVLMAQMRVSQPAAVSDKDHEEWVGSKWPQSHFADGEMR
jgi:hypothetical protein